MENILRDKLQFTPDKIKEALKSDKIAKVLQEIVSELKEPVDINRGNLIFQVASASAKDQGLKQHWPLLLDYITRDKPLETRDQITAALDYLKKSKSFDREKFEYQTGYGVVVSDQQLEAFIKSVLAKQQVQSKHQLLPTALKSIRADPVMKWSNAKVAKDISDKLIAEYDFSVVVSQVEQLKVKEPEELPFFERGELGALHKPGENPQVKEELMEQHLKETGGRVVTRFPPEPNGHLHIGHAKAINVNFGYGAHYKGITYLRYDDTNPEAEEDEYFQSILKSVQWLGFTPYKITYSSDYFQRLYELALKMIRIDKAYICSCSGDEIHKQRGGDQNGPRYDCPHRTRSVEESLKLFDDMKAGKYKEGEICLRMKMDNQNPNPQFWDLIAYRIKYTPHVRTGTQWCIYPTYDYTHCLVDSFENITHSLCTTEFVMSRESYYWLCDVLEVYKPVQWEYSRLNITNTVLSKRKLATLINDGYVNGWDDPRLCTLVALKRRGFPPEAINDFVFDCGVTTIQGTVNMKKLEFFVRQHMDEASPRLYAILDPVTVLIKNLPADHYEEIDVPLMPKNKPQHFGIHKVPLTNTIFVDSCDYLDQVDPSYYRFSKHGTIGLLNVPHPLLCAESATIDGKLVLTCYLLDPETHSKIEAAPEQYNLPAGFKIPKINSWIQWIAFSPQGRLKSPQLAEYRLYNGLFMHENPMDKNVVASWLDDINPKSLEVVHGYLEAGVSFTEGTGSYGRTDKQQLQVEVESKVQMTRLGFFAVDPDTKVTEETVQMAVYDGSKMIKRDFKLTKGWVWNRTVSLRESK